MRVQRVPIIILVAAALTVSAVAGTATAGEKLDRQRSKLLGWVNDYRHAHGLVRLRMEGGLNTLAQKHSTEMASRRTMFHTSDLGRRLAWRDPVVWGENVGYGTSIWWVFKAWTRSYWHNQNLLKPRFRHTGIGVVRSGRYFWVTMIYYG